MIPAARLLRISIANDSGRLETTCVRRRGARKRLPHVHVACVEQRLPWDSERFKQGTPRF